MVENINGASENNNQARQYPLNEQNIAAIANIMKLFKNGKGNDAQRAFQSLIETNLSGANSEATENDTHTLSGISKSLSQNCKHYIESLRGAKVVIDGDTYEFDVRTGGMSISNHDKDKHMQFSYDHQENVAIFDTEDGNNKAANFRLELDTKNDRINGKFEKGSEVSAYDFAIAFKDKFINLLKRGAIEYAKQEEEKNQEQAQKLKNLL